VFNQVTNRKNCRKSFIVWQNNPPQNITHIGCETDTRWQSSIRFHALARATRLIPRCEKDSVGCPTIDIRRSPRHFLSPNFGLFGAKTESFNSRPYY
jgi:hypothetical protein